MINDAYHPKAISKPPLNTDRDCLSWFVVVLITALVALLGLASRNGHAADVAGQSAGYDSAFGFGKQSLGISAGHGLALPVGGTQTSELEDIQFVYLTPRWGIGITDPLGGGSWYRGSFELLVEGTSPNAASPEALRRWCGTIS